MEYLLARQAAHHSALFTAAHCAVHWDVFKILVLLMNSLHLFVAFPPMHCIAMQTLLNTIALQCQRMQRCVGYLMRYLDPSSLLCFAIHIFCTVYFIDVSPLCILCNFLTRIIQESPLDRFVSEYSVRRGGHHHHHNWLLQSSEENQHLLYKQPLQSFKMFHIQIVLGLHFSSVDYLIDWTKICVSQPVGGWTAFVTIIYQFLPNLVVFKSLLELFIFYAFGKVTVCGSVNVPQGGF